jgi:predicted transcriptional regulator
MEVIMYGQEATGELLDFFKALADQNRLIMVGLLAQRPYSVEELADTIGLSVSTTSHHLGKLARAGLVAARVDGHYYVYSLQTEALKSMAQRLLQDEALPRLSADLSVDTFDRKVLANFTDAAGRITSFPAQEKKYLVLLRYVVQAFEPGVRYTEKQVNEILSHYNADTAMLRRSLVEYRFMDREAGGRAYWRTDQL